MASYYKRDRSPFYWKRIQSVDGTWKSVKSAVRVDAPNAIRKIKQEVAGNTSEERTVDIQSGSRWDSWVPKFLYTRYDRSQKTLKRYLNAWTALEVYLDVSGISTPSELTFKHCKDYPEWRTDELSLPAGMKPCNWNTALFEIKVMGPIMQHAIYLGFVGANPCMHLGLSRRDVKKKPRIQPEEVKTIEKALAKAPAWMKEMWVISMLQGLRLLETAVPLSRINIDLMVVSTIGKGGKIHTAPLHPDLLPFVRRAMKEKRSHLVTLPKHPSKCWSQWFDKIGLPHITFHSVRRTVVTLLAEDGHPQNQTKAYVGHATDTSHEVYVSLEAPHVAHLGKSLKTTLSASLGNPSGGKKGSSSAKPKQTSKSRNRRASQSRRISSV